MRWFRWRFRLRSLMFLIVLLALILGWFAEMERSRRRWSRNQQAAAEHAQRWAFYLRLATRFEELARVESERAAESTDDKEAADSATRVDSLRKAAREYSKSARDEGKAARELLLRW